MAKSKKVLDRDMMFRKIMPALADNPFSTPVTRAELLGTPDQPEAAPEPQAPRPVPQEAGPAPEPEPAPAASPSPGEAPDAGEPPAPPPQARRRPSLSDAPFTTLRTPRAEEDSLSVLRARLFARSGGTHTGLEQVSTVNLMESLVLQHLDEVIRRFNCCRCDRCRRDIAACALNLLPPQYVVADPAHLDALSGTIPEQEIYNALIKAVLKVRANPRH